MYAGPGVAALAALSALALKTSQLRLARANAEHNVTINNLLPGTFDTDRLKSNLQALAKGTKRPIEEVTREIRSSNPSRRFGRPDEFGATCAFLCSAHAGYITGHNILVGGGAYPGTF